MNVIVFSNASNVMVLPRMDEFIMVTQVGKACFGGQPTPHVPTQGPWHTGTWLPGHSGSPRHPAWRAPWLRSLRVKHYKYSDGVVLLSHGSYYVSYDFWGSLIVAWGGPLFLARCV